MQLQSNSRRTMAKRKPKYIPMDNGMRKLNASAKPVRVKSSNESSMSRMKSKAFSAKRYASKTPTNMSKKAVTKATSGRPGAGRAVAGKKSGVNTSRVMQISPAQFSTKTSPTSKTVALNPGKQNKKVRTLTLGRVQKSIRKSMGY